MRRSGSQAASQRNAESIADTVVNRMGLKHRGRDLLKSFSGNHNVPEILHQKPSRVRNRTNVLMGLPSTGNARANIAQLESAINASPDIAEQTIHPCQGEAQRCRVLEQAWLMTVSLRSEVCKGYGVTCKFTNEPIHQGLRSALLSYDGFAGPIMLFAATLRLKMIRFWDANDLTDLWRMNCPSLSNTG